MTGKIPDDLIDELKTRLGNELEFLIRIFESEPKKLASRWIYLEPGKFTLTLEIKRTKGKK